MVSNELKNWRKISDYKTASFEEIMDDIFGGCFCCSPAPLVYYTNKILPYLLLKIDAKIAELEMQL